MMKIKKKFSSPYVGASIRFENGMHLIHQATRSRPLLSEYLFD